jgi:hypothetical protein
VTSQLPKESAQTCFGTLGLEQRLEQQQAASQVVGTPLETLRMARLWER